MAQVKAFLLPKGQKLQFAESFSSFPKDIGKREKIQVFSSLIINPLIPASRWQRHWGNYVSFTE